ncbi:MAG: hypothetical protein ISS17_09945 [Bacteroidales bacterium]|nr:hypothetical protein [Bacteroidales bacterium]
MQKRSSIRCKILLTGLLSLVLFTMNLFPQKTTFGDLIPDIYLPSTINPSELLDCNRYFQLADSINQRVFELTGVNPIPEYHCGNDTLSYLRSSIEETLKEISPGSVLARMIIDRTGSPVCCKVYMKETDSPGKQVEDALSKLTMVPCFRNGEPIPTECRFVYDFFAPRTYGKKIID